MASQSPMLAHRDSLHTWFDKVRFPLYASPKIDGIRCLCPEGKAVSRSFTGIANDHIRRSISIPDLAGLDGELVVGPLSAENVFNTTSSAVMGNKVKTPDFEWYVFDDFTDPNMPFDERDACVGERMLTLCKEYPFLRRVETVHVDSWKKLEEFEYIVLELGFEGVITRSPTGVYKFGRSNATQQGMLKLKRFEDSEAQIIGFEELMRNTNPDIRDNLGHAKRSKSQAGLVPGGTLGKMIAVDLLTGIEFKIGMFKGLTNEVKQEMWDNRQNYMGRIVKYQHFAHGAIDKPRHSKFLGWRDKRDM